MGISAALLIALSFPGCKSGKDMARAQAEGQIAVQLPANDYPAYILPATVFQMSGDYADRVGVTLGLDGSLVYFPAPTDVTASSAPYPLGDGWYINRQGIAPNSVFTKWTFDEYAALDKVPSAAEIIEAIIPGAKVTRMEQLPLNINEAINNPAECAKYLKDFDN